MSTVEQTGRWLIVRGGTGQICELDTERDAHIEAHLLQLVLQEPASSVSCACESFDAQLQVLEQKLLDVQVAFAKLRHQTGKREWYQEVIKPNQGVPE